MGVEVDVKVCLKALKGAEGELCARRFFVFQGSADSSMMMKLSEL